MQSVRVQDTKSKMNPSPNAPDLRCPHFPPLTVTRPSRDRALRPRPTTNTRRHQKAPCHPRPPPVTPPAGMPHSARKRLRLKPVISAHRLIPTESAPNPLLLLTSPARLCHSGSMRFLRWQPASPRETNTPCLSKHQRDCLHFSAGRK